MKYPELVAAMDRFISEHGLDVLCRNVRVKYINGEPHFVLKEEQC